jgi:hypothetical protein
MKLATLLLVAITAAGCAGPQLLTTPQQAPLARGDGFSIEYVETPYATSRPRLLVREERADADGRRPARVRVLGPGGQGLRPYRNLFRRSEFAFEVPVDHRNGDAYDVRLTLLVDRPGEPLQRQGLYVRLRKVETPTAPLVGEDPGPFAMATYPIWGLWRDLLDAPFTAFNRAGLTTARLGDNDVNAANALVIGGAAAGAMLGAREGFRRGDSFFEDAFYVGAGSVVGGFAGAMVGVIVAGVWEWIVVPIETAIFRFPFDHDFIKREPYAVPVPVGEGIDLDLYTERHRSKAYFPNWRFGARGDEFLPSDRARPIWIVEHLGIGSSDA